MNLTDAQERGLILLAERLSSNLGPWLHSGKVRVHTMESLERMGLAEVRVVIPGGYTQARITKAGLDLLAAMEEA